MQPALKEELDALHRVVVSDDGAASAAASANLERFGALLRTTTLPRTHNYWNHFYYYGIKQRHARGAFRDALALAREGTAANPDYAGVWALRAGAEYQLGLLVDAFHSYKIALRRDPKLIALGSQLVSILVQRRRYGMAVRIGRALVDAGQTSRPLDAWLAQAELGLRRAGAAIRHLDAFEAAGPGTDYTNQLRARAERLLAHRTRHIAIAGMSYVGSTLFGTLLGSLPGCGHAGETQELIYRADPKTYDFRVIYFDAASDDSIPQCRVCGGACAVFTRVFRAELSRDPVDWYFRIGRRMGVKTVVTSDKFLSEYLAKDPLGRFDVVILYRSLPAWVSAHRREEARKIARGAPRSPGADDLEKVLGEWANNYHGFLKELRPTGRRIVVNWERFAENPRAHFDAIAQKLGLDGDSSVFDRIRTPHYFGGNDGIAAVLAAGRVEFRPPRTEPPSPEDLAIIERPRLANSVYRMLEASYRSEFRDIASR